MNVPLVLVLIVLAAALTGAAAAVDENKNRAEAVVEWLREKNGYFHSDLEIRRRDYHDDSSSFGVFATANIAANTPLIVIPRECLITGGENGDVCDTTQNLIEAMTNVKDSKYAPYVNYLLDQPAGQLPSVWSDAGKALLLKILGTHQHLPPSDVTLHSWQYDCAGGADSTNKSYYLQQNVYMLVLQRGWDDILIPMFDMLNHRNGKWLNTISNPVHDTSEDVVVSASRDIQAGDEIYNTYNFCVDCGNREFTYGTPEILRDYGFVEPYPQRWIFHAYPNLAFEVDQDDESDKMKITWLFEDPPSDDSIDSLEQELTRLRELAQTDLQEQDMDMTQYEWDVIVEYHQALTNAMALAIANARETLEADEQCVADDDTCTVSSSDDDIARKRAWLARRYDELEEEPDDLNYSRYTCEFGRKMDFPDYTVLEEFHTPYQRMEIFRHPQNRDTCFSLDHIIQICGSYRPHYHEMMVHYTARYLDRVTRVVWVGGGDSMLLHEIVKYPTLELVVGLELDQTVTRKSFKHFGTQPHWDNGKVQWWYGDASKSLLMLPKDYFGSFDMVLVDLSETVMSMTVTEGLDIFGALALLLKPDGIIVKNELYLRQISALFEFTAEVAVDDVPVVCDQEYSLGTYENDLLLRVPKDHGIPTLYYQPLKENENPYDIWHAYRRRETGPQRRCKEQDQVAEAPTEQKRSPGILMILEAEDASATLEPSKKVKDTIEKALKKAGLKVLSTVVSGSDEGGAIVVVVLREGYVVARTWPKHKYCAFDIHLWSRFDLHESVKKALIAAVGSKEEGKSSSSYRIVAGGMFGVKTWKEDEMSRGPRATRSCDRPAVSLPDASIDVSAIGTFVAESMSLTSGSDVVVAVLCGHQTEPCESLTALSTSGKVHETVALWTCPTMKKGTEHSKDAMFACEKDVSSTLNSSVTEEKKIRAIVIDPSAPLEMARIVHKVLERKLNRKRMLTEDIVVVAPMLDETGAWRKAFLERFRKRFVTYDPVYRAEVFFNSSDSSMEIGVFSSGDRAFLQRLVDVTTAVEKQTGLVSDLRFVHGGLHREKVDFVPSQFFLPEHYNQSGPLEQWFSQKPLGHQTISQLEVQWLEELVVGDTVLANWDEAGKWYTATVISVNAEDDTFDVRYHEDGSTDEGLERHLIQKKDSNKPKDEELYLSTAQVKDALLHTLSSMESENMATAQVHEFTEAGDGCVFVALWPGGSVIVLWDGRIHVDINLFTYAEREENPDEFSSLFVEQIPGLTSILKDEQPRGIGRVVNFLKDLPRANPHWA